MSHPCPLCPAPGSHQSALCLCRLVDLMNNDAQRIGWDNFCEEISLKVKEILPFATSWMDLGSILLSV